MAGVFLLSCGGISERTYDIDEVSWILFTRSPALLSGSRAAQVEGSLEMDRQTGCVYLHQPEFDISYPTVWPRGTRLTETGIALSGGRSVDEGDWVSGGGGYVDLEEIEATEVPEAAVLERCPGINNQYGEVAVFDSPASEVSVGTAPTDD